MLEVFFITASSLILLIQAQDGISTPPMGWSTWNKYGCHINEQLIKDAADLIVSQGYHNAGYTYLNMDDCWQSNERTSDGHIIIDRENFPNGIRPISDYVHSKGLKFGIYSSAGRQTCAGRMASSGYELQDAQTYANMGVDYLKYDNCNYDEGVSAKTRYEIMAKAINTTGRQIFISVCNWGTENTWEWAYQYGHSFRTHDDIYNDWKSIVEILNVHATVVNNSGPGQWADPDMLEIGNDRLTVDESKTHFSIWSAMKSPLILGNSLSDMPSELYNFVTNKNVIAVNQDPLGLPAKRILHVAHDKDIWVGELVNQTMVVVIINYMDQHQTFNIDTHYCGYIGSDIRAFDLWENATIPMKDQRYINNLIIPPHGVSMFTLSNGTIIDSVIKDTEVGTNNDMDSTKLSRRYEAEDLNNMVNGLARRRGCLDCSGGAQVIALGKVNDPQTGTLRFRNIKIDRAGIYKLTIGYLDCFSWTTCGDYWTRRWQLGVTLNDHEMDMTNQRHLTIALKSHRQTETTGQYTLGMVLKNEKTLDITMDNPNGFGPSIDYIEVEWVQPLDDHDDNTRLFFLPFWQSHDPLASSDAWALRWIADYFWEWMGAVLVLCIIGFGSYFIYTRRRRRRNNYTNIASSNSSIITVEE